MQFTRLAALVASISTSYAATRGFNYGSTLPNGAAKALADFQNEFTTAQQLTSGPGFTSARLYTMIQAGTANTPISAIQAAINTKTQLLLGLWASAGQDAFNNELAALDAAIKQYGTAFTDLVYGISVGSEDLYRITPTGIANNAGIGAGPDTLVTYIGEVRNVIQGTILAGKPVGHVDTWTAYVNGSNNALISACDFLGVDAYPYFETTTANSIENGNARFFSAYDQTVAASQNKPVIVTESGWPVSGPVSGQAVASVANSKAYYDSVGCELFARGIDTWWYTLYDGTPSPSFGIVGSTLSTTPLFDLTCPAAASSSTASTASVASSTQQQTQAASTTLATVVKPTTTAVAPTTTAQATTAAAGTTTAGTVVSQISDGQVQAGTTKAAVTSAATSAATPAAGTTAAAQPSGKSCPAALTGTWEYPHLIVPVDKNQPSKAAGTSYFGEFNDHISSVFNFDLPASYAGKTCSLVFLFPTQDQLTTSSYTFAGQGGLNVYELSSPVTESTSYSTVPAGVKIANIPDVKPGNSYTVASHECAAGQRISFEFEATSSLALRYFQDYNPSPIGAYISVC